MKHLTMVAVAVASLCVVSMVRAAAAPELELVDGPKMVVLAQKGAMIRVLQAQDMIVERAHQLKFTFFPAIEDESVKVKLYRSDDTSQARELMRRGGRTALIDLDPGPSGLQVILEEQGLLKQSTRIFASLYRYPLGQAPAAAVKPQQAAAPDKIVDTIDVLETAFKGDKRAMQRALGALRMDEKQAGEFLVAMANVRAYIGKKDLSAANYFLAAAQRIVDCAEVWYWRAFAFGVFDLDQAQDNVRQALERYDAGRTVAALFGDDVKQARARCHILAANLAVRQVQANPRRTDEELTADQGAIEGHLKQATELDPGESKAPCELIRRKWHELVEARRAILAGGAQAAEASGLPAGVREFLEARQCFVDKKLPEALKMLDTLPDMPEGDAQYLRAEIMLQLGRREGARKALEKSIADFGAGRCLAGKDGGTVPGAQGVVPPASARAALARVSLARYWAERFKREQTEDPTKPPRDLVSYLETAIELMEKALVEAPSYKPWQSIVNAYRDERLRVLYPGYAGPSKR